MAATAAQRQAVRLLILLSLMSAVFIGGGAYAGLILADQINPGWARPLAIGFATGGLGASALVIRRVTRRGARLPPTD